MQTFFMVSCVILEILSLIVRMKQRIVIIRKQKWEKGFTRRIFSWGKLTLRLMYMKKSHFNT